MKWKIILCFLVFSAISCNDNNSKSNNSGSCDSACVDSMLVTCDEDGNSILLDCKFGCENGSCLGDPNDPSGCRPSCTGSVATVCNEMGVAEQIPCTYGCNGNTCASAPVSSGPCSGITCKNAGNCDRGICVSRDMSKVREGDECDKWFQGYCDGDTKVVCSGGKITTSDCSDAHGCAMSKVKLYGDTYLIPTCRKDGASCDKGKAGYCVTENNAGKSEAHAYALTCWDNTDNTMSGDKGTGDYLLCSAHGCNPQKTGCWNQCQGDKLSVYNESTLNCAGMSQICVTEEQNGFCADACWQDGEIVNNCVGSNARERICQADDNGKLYYADSLMPCDHGCDKSTGKCKKLVSDEYTACDWNTFPQRCENGIRVACVEGIVRAEKCSDVDKTCAVIQNAALCLKGCDSAHRKYCDGNDLITETCEKNEAGILVLTDQAIEHCKEACSKSKLECVCKDNGKWCSNNAITRCDSKTETIVSESCGSKYCVAYDYSPQQVNCFDKKYNTLADCEKERGCRGKTFYKNEICAKNSSQDDNGVYGIQKEEDCEHGCSRVGCCPEHGHYNRSEDKCECDDGYRVGIFDWYDDMLRIYTCVEE